MNNRSKFIALFVLAHLAFLSEINAQFKGFEISASAGVPIYGEEYHPEKSFDTITWQECQSLRRSGYFSKGSLNYNLGVTAKYDIKGFSFFTGLSYTFFGYSEWAIPDSAIKYALCTDPYISSQRNMNCINIPIGMAYTYKKLKLGLAYGVPIVTFVYSESGQYSNNTMRWNSMVWFYKSTGLSYQKDYYMCFVQYQLTEPLSIQVSYKTNKGARLNHLAFGMTYSFAFKT